MPTVLPNVKGHYPKGYPRGGAGGVTAGYDASELEQATDSPDIQVYKTAVTDAQGDANNYFIRNTYARDWWYACWPNQTVDARKWGDPRLGIEPWPWEGACDTRLRTVEKVIGQHRTLATFALRNMKVQAKSTRPATSIRESQQATTLLNWMLFSHMQAELHRELRLAISWRNGYGAAVICADWEQMRQLDYIDVNVMGLQEFINEPAVRSFVGTSETQIPIGENLSLTDLQEMIMDPAYADDLATLLRAVSHEFLTLREARRKLDDLRQLRTVEIPVPYVFKSKPRLTALRPMVDVIFPAYADDLQRVPWTDWVEFVSETELRDRIETAGYDKQFVEDAIERRGPSSNSDWLGRTVYERQQITHTGGTANPFMNDIELHHFYTLAQDRGVPVRFCTVFHMDIEEPAKHEPAGYDHGESCFHPLRFEIDERPILSSRGIAEIAYTWEAELKTQYDAQADRTALGLRPILITTYEQVLKMKANMQPGAIIPMRKFDEAQWMKPPPWDQVSILIVQEVEKRIREHFGIFGVDVDPDLKKLRQEEFVDDTLLELKPIVEQVMKLMRQFLPDAQVAAVVGPLNRPFQISREEIQGEFEISATVDLRNIDSDWLKEKLGFLAQLAQLDTQGLLNKTALLKAGAEAIDYSFADMAIQDEAPATDAEVQDEQRAIDLIIGSGQDQPLPRGGNYQLRLQTLQTKLQEAQNNPATVKILQSNPDILKVIETRAQFYQRQLQQQQNAQIGRMQVSQTFSKQAPQQVAPGSALMNY